MCAYSIESGWQIFYYWKSKYGESNVSDASKLKKLLAEQMNRPGFAGGSYLIVKGAYYGKHTEQIFT